MKTLFYLLLTFLSIQTGLSQTIVNVQNDLSCPFDIIIIESNPTCSGYGVFGPITSVVPGPNPSVYTLTSTRLFEAHVWDYTGTSSRIAAASGGCVSGGSVSFPLGPGACPSGAPNPNFVPSTCCNMSFNLEINYIGSNTYELRIY